MFNKTEVIEFKCIELNMFPSRSFPENKGKGQRAQTSKKAGQKTEGQNNCQDESKDLRE